MDRYKNQALSYVKFLVGWPLSLISLAYLIHFVIGKSQLILPKLGNINFFILLLASIFFVICYFLRILAWYLMINTKEHKISFRENIYRWQISEVKRYVPGNIWSFIGRASLYSELGVGKKESGKAMLIEIELVVIASFLLSFFALETIQSYFRITLSLFNLQIGFLIASAFLVSLFIFGQNLNARIFKFLPHYSPKTNALILLVYLIAFIFLGVGTYFSIASVFGINFMSPIASVGIFMFALLIGYLSLITPSGIGVREGVITFALSKSLGTPIAGFIAIFSRIALVTTELLFTLILILLRKLKIL